MRSVVSGMPSPRIRVLPGYLCLVLILGSGCVSLNKPASPEVVASIRRIVIVPMEPPPLDAGGGFLEDLPEGFGPQDLPLLVLVAGVLLLESPSEDVPLPMDLSEKVAEWYAGGRAWAPTTVLAREVADRLSAAGNWDVLVKQELCSPPALVHREMTWHMENWLRPLRKWYNQSTSALSPAELDRLGADAVLEVGILNYQFIRDHFVLQVMTKLATVPDGTVRARARSFVTVEIEDPRELFDDQAQGFKQLVTDQGKQLLEKDLQKMRLVHR